MQVRGEIFEQINFSAGIGHVMIQKVRRLELQSHPFLHELKRTTYFTVVG